MEYSIKSLQEGWPQPMYDRDVNRFFKKIFFENPSDNHELNDQFKAAFLQWLSNDKLNTIRGISEFQDLDICVGCTQFIDDLYQTWGSDSLMILEGDYKYHWRLNQNIKFHSLSTLVSGKRLLMSMPFPSLGDIHPEMTEILNRCLELGVPVHLDGAWLGCSRNITFDFSHPAIESFAISLSKALGLGGNRVALRFSRQRSSGPISIMNDFNMTCQSLSHVGLKFMKEFGANYFWNRYGAAYHKICTDFDLTPTNAIHVAKRGNTVVGTRPLLRFLEDR